jgi:predicted transposase YbfD/YdcC
MGPTKAAHPVNLPSPLPYLIKTPDTRQKTKIHYPHETLWLLALFAIASGQNNILAISQWIHHNQEFLLEDLGLRTHDGQAKLPSQATLYRFFWRVEQQISLLESRIRQWAIATTQTADLKRVHASVDGKVSRGSRRSRAEQRAIELLSLHLHEIGLTLHQERLTGRESTQARRCMKHFREFAAFLVTADAAYLDAHFARAVTRAGGNYLIALSNNAPDVLESACWIFTLPEHERDTSFTTSEVRSGEVWSWRVQARVIPAELANAFPGCRQVVACQREVFMKATGEVRTETKYAVTSTDLPAQKLAAIWRAHWGVENRSHHKRDTVFGEDACRSRNAAQALAALRNVVLGVFHAQGERRVLMRVRRFAARPQELPAFFGWTS